MSTQTEKLDKMLKVVQALLAQADHPNTTPTEADTFRAKAEALMFKYRIDEAMLGVEDKARYSIVPVMREWAVCRDDSDFYNQMYHLALQCLRHVDGMYTYKWARHPDGITDGYWLVVEAYGYESDLRFAEMLFTSCQMTFSARLEPKVDPTASEADNVYNLRMGGVERTRIAVLMGWAEVGDIKLRTRQKSWDPEVSAAAVEAQKRLAYGAGKATKLFRQACAARGEDPDTTGLGKGLNPKTYRESFANAFVDQIRTRFWRLRNARGQETGALVLKSRKEDVKELLYQHHPELRPDPNPEPTAKYMPCARCAAAKSGYCREHKPLKQRAKPVNYAAGARGEEAANRVDLTGGSHPTNAASGASTTALEG